MMSNYDIEVENVIIVGLIVAVKEYSEVLAEWKLRLVESLLMALCSIPF